MTVACFLWDGEPADRKTRYCSEHVNALRRMVAANLDLPHDFVCLTDDETQGFDDGIRAVELPEGVFRWGRRYPKLWLFGPDAGRAGERILALDLDTVVTGDLTPLVSRDEPFVIWRDPSGRGYNTSMVLMDAGSRPEVWSKIPATGPQRVRGTGSDQAWVSHVLGSGEATWTDADGVLSYKRHCRNSLPSGARIVFFHGSPKPWDKAGWPKDRWAA